MLRSLIGLLGVAVAGCSRTGLDVPGPSGDGGATCSADAGVGVGTPARTSTAGQEGPSVVDPDDDLLLVVGGLTSSGVAAKSLSAVRLGTGEPVALARAGDSNVALGPSGRAVWDEANHRAIVIGDSLSFYDPSAPPDASQVFWLKVQGTSAVLGEIAPFPGGQTDDIALAAAIDPTHGRLLVIQEKGSVAGPIETWALDLGSDSWSLLDTDSQAAVANVQLVSLAYDANSRRMIGFGAQTIWALSLDAPHGWAPIDGTLPPVLAGYASVLGGGPALVWNDDLCAFVVAFTDGYCLYQVWRVDIGATTFTMTALGVVDQPTPRYGRGMGAFDVHRKNFVFGSAFDCNYEHDYVAASTDFLPVTP